jgi:pimeloyl-ACP methyl ester carboxylesterase/menaquinone-dependent protoporphyrinogen IX oxidase
MTPMQHLVIVFESRYGQARKIAERVGELARGRGVSSSIVQASEVTAAKLREADAVIIVAPVYDRAYPESVRNVVLAHASVLAARPTGFFSVSLGAAAPFALARKRIDKLARDFFADLSWRPDVALSLGGALAYPSYKPHARFLMKVSAGLFGLPTDTSRTHELTDWTALERATLDVLAAAPASEVAVHETTTTVAGLEARALVGGRGERLLLVHGGWGGASLHWGPVVAPLAHHFEVIAPDLPGIGRTDQAPLGSVGAYARWLVALMDALEVPDAWCIGNSFGASVACRLASDYPERCRGLVLVNGIPMPATPPVMRRLGERRLAHRLLHTLERRIAYSPQALKRAFADPARVPNELRALVRSGSAPQVDAFVDILVAGGSPIAHGLAPLLLWGADDRLLGTTARSARKLHSSWPGSELALVPRAGHMPQVENPAAFVDALTAFVGSHAKLAA